MKTKLTLICVAVLSVAMFSACAPAQGKGYRIYTNMNGSDFTVTSKDYEVAQFIGSGQPWESAGTPAENSASFTTRQTKIYAMDTEANLVVSADFTDEETVARYETLCSETAKLLEEVEISLTAFEKTSATVVPSGAVYAFNEAEAGAKVELDERSFEVLSVAKRMYELTEGYYNPAVYYSGAAYGFYGTYGTMTAESLPAAQETEAYRELAAHFGDVELFSENGAYYVVKPTATVTVDGEELAMKIDLGGIGKGYAVDKVSGLMDAYGFSNGFFDFGSSSIAVKNQYRNGSYTLGMTDPRAVPGVYLRVNVSNVCLSTSGDYEKYYKIDGVRYCHVIDPSTGSPVQTGIMTATVIGGSAAEDDALTTALMAMGKDRAAAFIAEKLTDWRVVFTYDGKFQERT